MRRLGDAYARGVACLRAVTFENLADSGVIGHAQRHGVFTGERRARECMSDDLRAGGARFINAVVIPVPFELHQVLDRFSGLGMTRATRIEGDGETRIGRVGVRGEAGDRRRQEKGRFEDDDHPCGP